MNVKSNWYIMFIGSDKFAMEALKTRENITDQVIFFWGNIIYNKTL